MPEALSSENMFMTSMLVLESRLPVGSSAKRTGGQQQRVAIARALINRPPVLFADESTGNLDSKTRIEVMNMFSELNASGITVILVTHSTEIADCAKRTIMLKDGQIVNDPKHGTEAKGA